MQESHTSTPDSPPLQTSLRGFEAYLVPVTQANTPTRDPIAIGLNASLKEWKRLGAAAFVGAVLMVAISFLFPRIYEARVVVMPQAESDAPGGIGRSMLSQIGGLASLASTLLPVSTSAAESVAILQSDAFTVQFIEGRKLRPLLFPRKWDVRNQRWIDAKKAPTVADGLEYFDERIRSVEEDKKTGLVTLTVRWRNNQQAAEWANLLISDVNQTIRQRAITESNKTTSYLQQQLDKTSQVELRQAMFRLIEEQQKTLMLAETRPDYAFRVIDPARVPDLRQKVSPKRWLFAAVGCLLGMLIASGVVARRALREAP